MHDNITHYIPENKILVLTPPHEKNAKYAKTMECIMSIPSDQLAQWQLDRHNNYSEYDAYKKEMTSIILKSISAIYPNIDAAIEDVFTATSLTFKDEFLSTEGSMYGIKMPLGRVSTKITNLYLGGQNCYLHGIYGTVRTALETIKLIEKDDD